MPLLPLCGKQFGKADQIIGDQVEHEVGGHASDAAMFGFAHGAVLLAPAEDAFDHGPTRLRHSVTGVPGGSPIDGALAPVGIAAVVLGDVRRNVLLPQLGDVLGPPS